MAQYGAKVSAGAPRSGQVPFNLAGRTRTASPLPRVHGVQAPTNSTSPQLGNASPPNSVDGQISLTQPRPDQQRSQNEYIETPLRPHNSLIRSSKRNENNNNNGSTVAVPSERHTLIATKRSNTATASSKSSGVKRTQSFKVTSQQPVTNQPGSVTFKKDGPSDNIVDNSGCTTKQDSIICQDCGRCRCDVCRNPRPLPSRWICNEKCLCSAETVLDYCTCVCCVKGLFYHCSKDYDVDSDGVSCADKPCSCNPNRRCLRWGCMSALAVLLPCLWCYWPMRGCIKLCGICYQKYHNHGCQCIHRNSTVGTPTGKRLLDSPSDC